MLRKTPAVGKHEVKAGQRHSRRSRSPAVVVSLGMVLVRAGRDAGEPDLALYSSSQCASVSCQSFAILSDQESGGWQVRQPGRQTAGGARAGRLCAGCP